jgi:hypothetical protein
VKSPAAGDRRIANARLHGSRGRAKSSLRVMLIATVALMQNAETNTRLAMNR